MLIKSFLPGDFYGIIIAHLCNLKRLLRCAPLDYTGTHGLERKCRMRGASFSGLAV